jgi:hypothetical protein
MFVVNKWCGCFVCAFVYLLLTGCTHVVNPAGTATSYPERNKINLSVQLSIPESLRAARIENSLAGDIWIIELGDSMVRNTRLMAQALFTRVQEQGGNDGDPSGQADIVLIPRLVTAEASHAVWVTEESVVTLAMEWTIRNASGETVWVDTVKGEGSSEGGSGFAAKGSVEKRVNAAIDALFKNSFAAISDSPAIIINRVKVD